MVTDVVNNVIDLNMCKSVITGVCRQSKTESNPKVIDETYHKVEEITGMYSLHLMHPAVVSARLESSMMLWHI